MASNAALRLALLFSFITLFCNVRSTPVPEPNPKPAPFYGVCTCRPPSCCIPACRASTTTCGVLVVPTMSTVHTKGCTQCCDGCGGCCGGFGGGYGGGFGGGYGGGYGGCGGCCGGGGCGGNCGSGCGSLNYGGQCCACT